MAFELCDACSDHGFPGAFQFLGNLLNGALAECTRALQALRAYGRPAATWTAEAVPWPQA
jgi:hypothetical protein